MATPTSTPTIPPGCIPNAVGGYTRPATSTSPADYLVPYDDFLKFQNKRNAKKALTYAAITSIAALALGVIGVLVSVPLIMAYSGATFTASLFLSTKIALKIVVFVNICAGAAIVAVGALYAYRSLTARRLC